LAIVDAGMPLPKGVPVIDLSLVPGHPSFDLVMECVTESLVWERAWMAEETQALNPRQAERIGGLIPAPSLTVVSHQDLKQKLSDCVAIIRTGECSPYANLIVAAGVDFPGVAP
jgi:D-ribose pyranase